MDVSDSDVSWESFCSADVLQFRASCNLAVESSLRPINRRVIQKIADSPEARELFRNTWKNASPGRFFQVLSADPSWHTVVNEELHSERAWGDLFDLKWFKEQFREWLKSFVRKLVGSEHPVTRMTTSLVVALSALFGINQIPGIKGRIALPVQPMVSIDAKASTTDFKLPVRVTLEPKSEDLQVKFDLSANVPPTRLQFLNDQKTEVPLSFKFVSPAPQSHTIPAPGTKADPANNALTFSVTGPDMSGVNKSLADIANGIGTADTKLAAMSDAFTYFAGEKGAYKTASERQLQAENKLIRTNSNHTLSLVLRENTPQAVILPYFDDTSGKLSSSVINIRADRIIPRKAASTVSVSVVVKGHDPKSVPHILRQGDILPLAPLPWSLIVNLIENRWPGRHMVQVFLVPEVLPGSVDDSPKTAATPATGAGTVANNTNQ
jgi:hypothetical protein